jgi:IMP dehydrogenase
MKTYHSHINEFLCFDDILLIPHTNSEVLSRYNVDLTMQLGNYQNPSAILNLKLPVIASPMDTICEWEMANAISKVGGLGLIHRFMDVDSRISNLNKVEGLKGVAVSLIEARDEEIIRKFIDCGVKVICIDTANGHAKRAIDSVKELRNLVSDNIHIMCGNVSTKWGYEELMNSGADSVRVGIGGGSACTTRLVSGYGMPTLASIMDCRLTNSKYANHTINGIIADGGIRNTGDMVKSFAAGANAVMIGSLLSGYDESPGEIIKDQLNRPLKSFRGMASKEAQEDWLGGVSVSEGIATTVPYKGKVSDFLKSVIGGIGSGCSYGGCTNLNELYKNAEYIKVSSATINESKPHAKTNV